MNTSVTLIDAGTGNLRSVLKALESLGASVSLTSDPQEVHSSRRIVLPGVGAFGDFMDGLRSRGLEPAVREAIQEGALLLGICVGMQALFEIGEEMGEHLGLGILPGRVVRFPALAGLKIPHTGWNQLQVGSGSPLWKNITFGDYAYFNHSYYCSPSDLAVTAAITEYGFPFASAVQRGGVFGVQFHPEKSQKVGLQVLENFLSF